MRCATPDYALFEGKTLVAVIRDDGHLYVASMDRPPFAAAAPQEHRVAFAQARYKLACAISDMLLQRVEEVRSN